MSESVPCCCCGSRPRILAGPFSCATAISSGVRESRCEPIERVQPSPESAPSAASRCSGAAFRLRAEASSVSSRGSRLSVTVREQQATCEHVDFIGLSLSTPLPGPKWPTCYTTGGVFCFRVIGSFTERDRVLPVWSAPRTRTLQLTGSKKIQVTDLGASLTVSRCKSGPDRRARRPRPPAPKFECDRRLVTASVSPWSRTA